MSSEIDLGKYLNPKVVSTVKRLDLQAKCIIEGFISGRHKSPFHGFSTDFSEHRRYNEGDPIKDIDWNVFGKTERYYIKKYQAETNLECTLMVDISSSMGYKHEDSDVSKLDYAVFLAAALSYLNIRQQDSVALITFDDKLCSYLKPKSKKTHLMSIIKTLANAQTSTATSFQNSLMNALSLIKHRGIVVVISDFLGDTENALKALQQLRYRKNDVVVFHVLDKAELDLPFSSMAKFIDTEDKSEIIANADQIRKAYKEEIDAFIERIRTECVKLNANYLQINTSQPFDYALEEFLMQRKKLF